MKLLKVNIYTPICKTENGSVGTVGRMLKLSDYIKSKNVNKNIQLRQIKGLKGWLRHGYMEYYKKKGIEVCYSSSKTEFKDRKVKIPNGFHVLGDCDGKCPIYEIFGGVSVKKEKSSELSKPSKLKVWSLPVVSEARLKKQSEEVQQRLRGRFNVMTFNTENGIAMGENDEGLQNFGKEFISGNFKIFIDVSKLDEEELKVLLEVLLENKNQLGGSKTNGNGELEIKSIDYGELEENVTLTSNGKITRKEMFEKLELPEIRVER